MRALIRPDWSEYSTMKRPRHTPEQTIRKLQPEGLLRRRNLLEEKQWDLVAPRGAPCGATGRLGPAGVLAGRRLKFLSVIEEHSRLCQAIRVCRRCKDKDLVAVLENRRPSARQLASSLAAMSSASTSPQWPAVAWPLVAAHSRWDRFSR